jgi:hypothetical protein
MEEIEALRDALDRLQAGFDDLAMRGLRAAGPADLKALAALRDEFRAAGAASLAERLTAMLDAIRSGDHAAAAALLRAMTAARLFDRMLTLEVAAGSLAAQLAADEASAEAEDE